MHDNAMLGMTRRQILAALGGGASAIISTDAAAFGVTPAQSEIASGTVFEDLSGTGQRGPDDSGIPGVMVSNGRHVVTTDKDGRWALPAVSGDCIFVIKPAHWALTHNSKSSTGYYLHQPLGTPQHVALTSPQVAPTGPLPHSVDFGLRRTTEESRFDVLLVADTQAATEAELRYVRADLQSITSATKAVFAIHHGDVMGDDLSLFPGHLAITRETGIPWFHCPGNHDMNLDSPGQKYALEAWKRYIGPTHSALQYAGATFILLNNVEYFGKGNGHMGGRGYLGQIGSVQLKFVENVLKNVPFNQLIVVSMHIPLVSFESPYGISDTTRDRRALMQLLSDRPHCVSFSGHSHTTEHHYLGWEDGYFGKEPHHHHVLTAACGSWWSGPSDQRGVPVSDSRDGSPRGVHVLSVDANTYKTRFVTSATAASPQLRALLVKQAEQIMEPAVPALRNRTPMPIILVDVFDGGPRTRVVCKINGLDSPAFELARNGVCDPYIVETYAKYKALCKPWVTPVFSSHIWSAALPECVVAGTYDCTIHVVSEYGEAFEARQSITVAA
jgi:hypothetical protein